MNTLTYKVANRKKFQVEYAFKNCRWHFRIGTFTLISKCRGGQLVAEQVAEALRQSWFRCGELDETAREEINRILKVRTLLDRIPNGVGY